MSVLMPANRYSPFMLVLRMETIDSSVATPLSCTALAAWGPKLAAVRLVIRLCVVSARLSRAAWVEESRAATSALESTMALSRSTSRLKLTDWVVRAPSASRDPRPCSCPALLGP